MKNLNLSSVHDSNKIQAGGYVAVITKVEDVPLGSNPQKPDTGDYLKIEFDIAEGPMAGYYEDMFESLGFWGGRFIRSYKPKALGMFKSFINTVKKCNPSFTWSDDGENDEQTLVGKYIGVVLTEEEYRGNDGSLKTRVQCDKTYSVDDIHNGKYKVPEKKALKSSGGVVDSTQTTIDDLSKEVPF